MSNSDSYHYKICGPQIMSTDATLLAFTFAMLVLRMCVRIQQNGRLYWGDALMILAWVSFAAQVACDVGIFRLGYFNFNDNIDLIPDPDWVKVLKLLWAENMTYYVCMYSVKLAMLIFLCEVIPPGHWRIFLAVRVVFAFAVVGFLITELGFLLKCRPITNAWSLNEEANFCNQFPYNVTLNVFVICFHMGTDAMIYLIPLFLLTTLRSLPFKQKIGAGIMFAIGLFTIVFGLLFFLSAMFWLEFGYGWIFAASEQATAITVACLPCLKIWLKKNVGLSVQRVMDGPKNESTTSVLMEKQLLQARGHVRLASDTAA